MRKRIGEVFSLFKGELTGKMMQKVGGKGWMERRNTLNRAGGEGRERGEMRLVGCIENEIRWSNGDEDWSLYLQRRLRKEEEEKPKRGKTRSQ